MTRRRGITRTVLVGSRWVVKAPSVHYRMLVRGWLANRSEWRQRDRSDVMSPAFTVGHVLLVVRRARWTGSELFGMHGPWLERDGDEAKPSSWGWYPGTGWLLIDYDRAWAEPRGWVGSLYYRRQEAKARAWARLP